MKEMFKMQDVESKHEYVEALDSMLKSLLVTTTRSMYELLKGGTKDNKVDESLLKPPAEISELIVKECKSLEEISSDLSKPFAVLKFLRNHFNGSSEIDSVLEDAKVLWHVLFIANSKSHSAKMTKYLSSVYLVVCTGILLYDVIKEDLPEDSTSEHDEQLTLLHIECKEFIETEYHKTLMKFNLDSSNQAGLKYYSKALCYIKDLANAPDPGLYSQKMSEFYKSLEQLYKAKPHSCKKNYVKEVICYKVAKYFDNLENKGEKSYSSEQLENCYVIASQLCELGEYEPALKFYWAGENKVKIEEIFEHWVSECPEKSKIRELRGDYAVKLGLFAKAVEYYQNALGLCTEQFERVGNWGSRLGAVEESRKQILNKALTAAKLKMDPTALLTHLSRTGAETIHFDEVDLIFLENILLNEVLTSGDSDSDGWESI